MNLNHPAPAPSAPVSQQPPPDARNLDADPRVYRDLATGRARYLDEDGVEWEWSGDATRSWFPVVEPDVVQAGEPAAAEEGAESLNVLPAALKRKQFLEEKKRKEREAGGADDTAAESEGNPAKKRKRDPKPPKPVTAIYLSHLPADVTASELRDVCSKYGIIMEDLTTGLPRIKIYLDADGNPKGDALVTYYKEESVALAIDLLDDAPLRPDRPEHPTENPRVKVSVAQFREKSDEERAAAQASRLILDKRTTQRKLARIDKKLDWFESGPSEKKLARYSRVVALKHMFSLKELEDEPGVLLEISEDVREECEKVGEVTSLTIYDAEPDGVILVRFKEELSALACIKLMDGRFFGGQKVTAALFDGTKYRRSKATDATDEARLQAYEQWLQHGDDKKAEP
ncbi:hypothetical protein H9P43_008661 [Blastocladiella emersonii ATCC 22665]|nr:hypothetical protein H9P43_008661 [Blastocladiella emersonii ATCC 22665]